MRPVCGADDSGNGQLSRLLADIITAVADRVDRDVNTCCRSTEEMIALCKEHSLYTWNKGNAVSPLPIERAEGIYLYTSDGERLIDFNSQLMSVNIGHAHPRVSSWFVQSSTRLLGAA